MTKVPRFLQDKALSIVIPIKLKLASTANNPEKSHRIEKPHFNHVYWKGKSRMGLNPCELCTSAHIFVFSDLMVLTHYTQTLGIKLVANSVTTHVF
jgi:hypothetical protein